MLRRERALQHCPCLPKLRLNIFFRQRENYLIKWMLRILLCKSLKLHEKEIRLSMKERMGNKFAGAGLEGIFNSLFFFHFPFLLTCPLQSRICHWALGLADKMWNVFSPEEQNLMWTNSGNNKRWQMINHPYTIKKKADVRG